MDQKELEKERDAAIKQIVDLLQKYDLTIKVEHNIIILPKESPKE
jgi:hypothetical protein